MSLKMHIVFAIVIVIAVSGQKFGFHDRYTCHCKAGTSACDNNTGNCSSDCSIGWKGYNCQNENVALNQPTEYTDVQSGDIKYNSTIAVDGVTTRSFSCNYINTGDSRPRYWQVQLQYKYNINSVIIYTKSPQQLEGFTITTGDINPPTTLCYKGGDTLPDNNGEIQAVHLSVNCPGQYLRFTNNKGFDLCEVEIYVCSPGTFGADCDSLCYCKSPDERCNKETGICPNGCLEGFHGTSCNEHQQIISSPTLNLLTGSPDSLLEGTVVKYACGFRLVSVSGVVKPVVEWFLDDYQLILTNTSRIKMSNTTNNNLDHVYNLEFDTAIPSYSGNLSCKITSSKNTSVTESVSTAVRIIPKPVVTLRPLSSFVKGGESQNLTCTSQLASSFNATYSWFDANTDIHIPQATSAEYTVSIIDKDLRLYCQVSNAAGTSQSQVAVIHHVPSAGPKLSCARSVDTRNMPWPEVKTGTIVTLECGDGYVGYAQRFCTESGQWKTPDYSNCNNTNLVMLKRQTYDVKEGKLVTTPEQALETLVNLTQEGDRFSAGDVKLSVHILTDVIDIINDDKNNFITKDELQNFASSAANVMNAGYEEWTILADQNKSGIAVMINTIDVMAQLTSTRLNQTAPITAITDKMIIEVGRSNVNDIKFPRAGESYPSFVAGTNNEILVQKTALQKYFTDDEEFGYNVVYYNDINNIVGGNVLNPGQMVGTNVNDLDINTKILAFSINPPPDKLDPEIYLTFQHTSDNYSNPQCVFLDFQSPFNKIGRWSTEGCRTEITSDPNITICKCNHLSNFAILMSPRKTPVKHIKALTYISITGCVISLLCLALTVVVYAILWRFVKKDKSIILLNLCVALIISYLVFLFGVEKVQVKAVCQTIAALLHFFYLVVFFLMLAKGVEVFISVVHVFPTKYRLKWILLLSWGIPAIIVGASLGITRLEGYGNDDFCWLSLDSGLLWAFVGPALCVIFINLVIMIKVLTVMFSTKASVTQSMKQKARTGLRAVFVLLPIMGLTWVFGVFSVNDETVIFGYLFAICNSLQGVFIFIVQCCMCKEVKHGINMKWRRYRAARSVDTGTSPRPQIPLNPMTPPDATD